MKLFLVDDINDLTVLVREDVTYSADYDVNGEIENLKINTGDGVFIDLKGKDENGQEKKYTVLDKFPFWED